MTENRQLLLKMISEELMKQFPDHKCGIVAVTDNSFTYELEKHGNFMYYIVSFTMSSSGLLLIDWEHAVLTVI
jgi:hypothetical protein